MKTFTEEQEQAAWKIIADAAMPILDKGFKQITGPELCFQPQIDSQTLEAGYAICPPEDQCGPVLMVVMSVGIPDTELLCRASFSQGAQCSCDDENPVLAFYPDVIRISFEQGKSIVDFLDLNYSHYFED